jgi:hypothetical protein
MALVFKKSKVLRKGQACETNTSFATVEGKNPKVGVRALIR